MDSDSLRGLPPNKRFRFLHPNGVSDPQSTLPAKKRRDSRDLPPLPDVAESYSLPAKKRVWALPPMVPSDYAVAGKPVFDLNADFNPFDDEEEVTRSKESENPAPEISIGDFSNGKSKLPALEISDGEEHSPMLEISDVVDEDGIVCAVCQSTDGDPLDPIVLCDGCDLMVHVSCYGSPLINEIPDGDWFCVQCIATRSPNHQSSAPYSCCLCPNRGGAMKPVSGEAEDSKWAHLVCALFVPEVFFEDSEGREGIDYSKVPKSRWEERCYVCKEINGCAIRCSEPKCGLAFHVTCGIEEDLCMEYRQGKKKSDVVAGFCKKHTDLWRKQEGSGKFKIVAREE